MPGLIHIGSFNADVPAVTDIVFFPISPTFCKKISELTADYYYLTPLGHMCSFFRYYRGGFKFHVKFTATSVVTGRVKFTWIPDPSYASTVAADEEGDILSMVVDITGNVAVDFTIPYLRQTYWTPVLDPATAQTRPASDPTGFNGQLVLTVINPVVNASDVTSGTVDFAIWMSGAEDFEVARPGHLWPQFLDGNIIPETEEVHVHAQMSGGIQEQTDMRLCFKKPFQTFVPAHAFIPQGIQMGETVNSWLSLGKRTRFYTATTGASFTSSPWDVDVGSTLGWDRLIRTFLMSRGSIRFKVQLVKDTSQNHGSIMLANFTTRDGTPTSLTQFSAGAILMDLQQCNMAEAEIPYYNVNNFMNQNYAYFNTELPKIWGAVYGAIAGGTYTWLQHIAYGDDFSQGWPIGGIPVKFLTSPAPEVKESSDDEE